MQEGTGGGKPLVAALSSLMTLRFYLKKAKTSSFNIINKALLSLKMRGWRWDWGGQVSMFF